MAMLGLIREYNGLVKKVNEEYENIIKKISGLIGARINTLNSAERCVNGLIDSLQDPALCGISVEKYLNDLQRAVTEKQEKYMGLSKRIKDAQNFRELVEVFQTEPEIKIKTSQEPKIIYSITIPINSLRKLFERYGPQEIKINGVKAVCGVGNSAANVYANAYNYLLKNGVLQSVISGEVYITRLSQENYQAMVQRFGLNKIPKRGSSVLREIFPNVGINMLYNFKCAFNKLVEEITSRSNAPQAIGSEINDLELKQIAETISQQYGNFKAEYERLDSEIGSYVKKLDEIINSEIFGYALNGLQYEIAQVPPEKRISKKIDFWIYAMRDLPNNLPDISFKINESELESQFILLNSVATDEALRRYEELKEKKVAEAKKMAYSEWLGQLPWKVAEIVNCFGISVSGEELNKFSLTGNEAKSIVYWLAQPDVKRYITGLAQGENVVYSGPLAQNGAEELAKYLLQKAREDVGLTTA
jgi:hypothetical protein